MTWSSLGGTTTSNTSIADEQSDKSSSESLAMLLDGETADDCNINGTEKEQSYLPKSNHGRLKRGNTNEFLCWAFFSVPYSTAQSSPEMQNALNDFYHILETRAGLSFEVGNNPYYTPRSFTFEKVKALYRPFYVYLAVALMRASANIMLYFLGFRQYTCKRGLKYWHRPAKQKELGSSPFLLFHGIAPGGYAPYLPMIFFGILRGDLSHAHRDIFLFENKPVSYAMCLTALSEDDTVHGVLEAINLHLPRTVHNLTLFGHSFGSCQVTWMIKCPEIKNRISSMILCDPVSILLSDADVVVNFLYNRQGTEGTCNGKPNSWFGKLIRFANETKIHLVASSEICIEHYLRRNFAWYNSELWLEDIPPNVKVVVALAEHDEIINTPKIVRELSSPSHDVHTIIWNDVGHAHCITNYERWKDIHNAMKRVEAEIEKSQRKRKAC